MRVYGWKGATDWPFVLRKEGTEGFLTEPPPLVWFPSAERKEGPSGVSYGHVRWSSNAGWSSYIGGVPGLIPSREN